MRHGIVAFDKNKTSLWLLNKRKFETLSTAIAKGTRSKISNKDILFKFLRFIWPRDDRGIKMHVVIAVGLLVVSKLLNVAVPFVFKEIVDLLTKHSSITDFGNSTEEKLLMAVVSLVIGYGAART